MSVVNVSSVDYGEILGFLSYYCFDGSRRRLLQQDHTWSDEPLKTQPISLFLSRSKRSERLSSDPSIPSRSRPVGGDPEKRCCLVVGVECLAKDGSGSEEDGSRVIYFVLVVFLVEDIQPPGQEPHTSEDLSPRRAIGGGSFAQQYRPSVATMPRRNKSRVWNYFSKKDKKVAVCDLCHHEINTHGTTSNLMDHIKRRHHTVPLMESVDKDQEIMDNDGFQKFIKELGPRYKLPSRRTLTCRLYPERYEILRERAQELISKVAYRQEKDPLNFWYKYEVNMPLVSKMAKKYLCIPTTSVPSERLFSKAGQICSDLRSRIKSTKVDKLLSINSNIHLLD
ncbi:hypothetical protein J437_LFUL014215 [Ladona fulva]|uniref:BED-type domain-containing protein n=1 Tax=Ladona fulva TaxID=123851 RepID=A0A8K0P5I8_LADFU|nr:hypothetical protein J437_LFUL014215 [Ladona fulva]